MQRTLESSVAARLKPSAHAEKAACEEWLGYQESRPRTVGFVVLGGAPRKVDRERAKKQ